MPPSLWKLAWLSHLSYGNTIFLREYSLTRKNIDICFVVFKVWDLARSTRTVLLYNISRNQLLGCSERRFWAILLFWGFKSAISWLLGHFRWFSSFGRYLDRFGLRFSIIYVGISFWDALSVDFEPDLLLQTSNMLSSWRPESSISRPWTPGCSQGVPKELPRVEQPVQVRF